MSRPELKRVTRAGGWELLRDLAIVAEAPKRAEVAGPRERMFHAPDPLAFLT